MTQYQVWTAAVQNLIETQHLWYPTTKAWSVQVAHAMELCHLSRSAFQLCHLPQEVHVAQLRFSVAVMTRTAAPASSLLHMLQAAVDMLHQQDAYLCCYKSTRQNPEPWPPRISNLSSVWLSQSMWSASGSAINSLPSTAVLPQIVLQTCARLRKRRLRTSTAAGQAWGCPAATAGPRPPCGLWEAS